MSQEAYITYSLYPKNAPTFIFLHGFLGNASQWNPVVNHFKSKFQLLVMELPGHGNNTYDKSYTINNLADCIANTLDVLQLQQVHFVGHSMGGYVGAAFAKAYSKKILSLTLINSCTSADTPMRKNQRDRSIEMLGKFRKAFISMAVSNLFTEIETKTFEAQIEKMKTNATSMAAVCIKNALIAMRDRPSTTEEFLNNQIPIRYVYGIKDPILSATVVKQEIELLPTATSYKLESGHMSILTHVDEVIEQVAVVG